MSNLKKLHFYGNNQNTFLQVPVNNNLILGLKSKSNVNFNSFKKILLVGNKNCKSCGRK